MCNFFKIQSILFYIVILLRFCKLRNRNYCVMLILTINCERINLLKQYTTGKAICIQH